MRLLACLLSTRPHLLARAKEMITAQSVPCELLVVENQSPIGRARNLGLEYARSHGYDWIVYFDDDDYYGPEYVRQIADHIHDGVDVLSAGVAFVAIDDTLYFCEHKARVCPGHSIAARVSVAADFPEIGCAEDTKWTNRMVAAGRRLAKLPPWHLVYQRRTNEKHAFYANRELFLRNFGPYRELGELPVQLADDPLSASLRISECSLNEISDEEVFQGIHKFIDAAQRPSPESAPSP